MTCICALAFAAIVSKTSKHLQLFVCDILMSHGLGQSTQDSASTWHWMECNLALVLLCKLYLKSDTVAWACDLQLHLASQARLESQQQNLQKRLKLALKIHQLCPQTSVDTMTVADKIVSALDKIAEVRACLHSHMTM